MKRKILKMIDNIRIKRALSLVVTTTLIFGSIPINVIASESNNILGSKDDNYEFYPIPHELYYGDENFNLSDNVNVFFEKGIDEYTINRARYALESGGLTMNKVDLVEPILIDDDNKKEKENQNKEEKEEESQNKEEKEEESQNKEEKEEENQNKEEKEEEKEEESQNKEEKENQNEGEKESQNKKIFEKDNIIIEKSIEDIQLYVGIYEDDIDSTVDFWFKQNVKNADYNVFNKTDSYLLVAINNKIAILGKDTDSAFYGLTTLKQIMEQSVNGKIKEIYIKDWADVASRGFIEGYYGEPWSTEDRVELMKFGGEIKLNSYFYAPKDDPKHNSKWYELYTDEELKEKIEPLAKAGNESKCQFVYALHPFMHNSINSDNYEEYLLKIKKKFEQVIKSGVRQIAVLADDASVPKGGPELYVKLMKDLVDWVSSEEMQNLYPGLKTTIPFCPNDYMGDGSSSQIQTLKQLPPTVPIVMTGGRVWGEVSTSFTDGFKERVERGPYLWINWPCTDNSKRHLIMGGFKDFLHTGVNPENIEGIVLNPMQQSEPSKVAIFGNGCYSWNIWDNDEQADKAWYDSFKYVNHLNYKETETSMALREISKHMINQNMDGRVRVLEESVELAPKLKDFLVKLDSGVLTKEDIDNMKQEFIILQNSARIFKEKGNERIVEQIIYWLDTWENITNAAIIFMNALEDYYINDDSSNIPAYYTEAQAQMEEAETHGFSYVDHIEYAEVGVQHIMPFMRKVRDKVAEMAEVSVNPTKLIITPITNRTDEPTGGIDVIRDKDYNTKAIFKSPNRAEEGTYIGLKFSKVIDLNSVRFEMGDSRTENNNSFNGSRIEYTEDGKEWKNIEEFQGKKTIIEKDNLNLKAKGVRLVCTQDTENIWISVREIYINDKPIEVEQESNSGGLIRGTIEKIDRYNPYQNSENKLIDGNDDTVAWYSMPGDTAEPGDYIGLNFGEDKKIGRVRIIVGAGDADKWNKYHIEYKASTDDSWHSLEPITGQNSGKDIIDINLDGALASQVRLVNDERKPNWVKFSEFQVFEHNSNEIIKSENLVTDDSLNNLQDKNDDTSVTFDNGNKKGDYIGIKLMAPKKVGNIRFVLGSNQNPSNKWNKYHLEYSPTAEGEDWIKIRDINDISDEKGIVELNLGGVLAQRVRIVNDENVLTSVDFSEITILGYNSKENTNEHIVSNNDNLIIGSYGSFDSKQAVFHNAFEMTLRPNDYIGIKLPRVSHISNIILNALNSSKLDIKIGANTSEMNNYISNSNKEVDARYIYVMNTTNDDITFVLDELKVLINEQTGILFDSLYKLPLAPNYNSEDAVEKRFNTGNWFDGNTNTSAVYSRYPQEGSWILFDLGQQRDIRKIEMIVNAQERNFIRSGKIQVGMQKDGEDWTDIVRIGNGNVINESDNIIAQDYTDTNGNVVWTTSGPNLVSVKGELSQPVKARYLRVYLDAAYSHRFISANELIINDGEYVPINGNPTFIVNPSEVSAEYLPDNMIDGNITTGFKPNMEGLEEGYFIYKLSETTDIAQINILQSSSAISNAKVYIRGSASDTATKEVVEKLNNNEWVLVSTLSEALNSIYTYDFNEIYEIKVEWQNSVRPFFYEIALIPSGALPIDVTELQKIYDKYGEITNPENYDEELLNKYNEVRTQVKELLDNPQNIKDQAEVNRMYNMLKTAYKNLISSVEELETAKQNLIKQLESYIEKDYTSKSWKLFVNSKEYKDAVVLKDSNIKNPQIFVDATLALIKAGETILQSIYDINTLKSLLESVSNLNLDSYTSDSVKVLKDVIKKVEEAIIKDDILPNEIGQLYNELLTAMENLVKIDKPSGGSSSGGSSSVSNTSSSSKPIIYDNNDIAVIKDNNKISVIDSKGQKFDIVSNNVENGIKILIKKDGKEIDSIEENIKIGIPIEEEGNMGLVAILVDEYGKEIVIKNSYIKDKNIVLDINKSCIVKVENRASKFEDVNNKNWFKNSVDFVTARGLFSGKSNKNFAPDDEMTRGMLASVLYRFANQPKVVGDVKFNDINRALYYSDAIIWATQNKIVHGVNENEFAPEDSITREQLVTILYRYAGSPKINVNDKKVFSDKDKISSYALDAVNWAIENNILSGRTDGTLDPKGNVTRAEVSTIFMNSIINENIK